MAETMTKEKSEQKADEPKRMRTVHLFRDNGKYKDPLFVAINGKSYLVERGKPVEVPVEVAEVIEHSAETDAQTAARMLSLQNGANGA